LVTLECSQIPDIDYSDNYYPVANYLIFRICLLIMLAYKLKAADLISISTWNTKSKNILEN